MTTPKNTSTQLWVIGLFAAMFCISCLPNFAAEKPNILYITFDDMNDWVGCLDGHPQIQTPNIDRLAERGVLFTNAHCAVPVCSGSRAATWTGWSPVKNGVYGNGQRIEKTSPNAIFLPQDLASQGYLTMGTGKLLHGKSEIMLQEYGPGFDKWMPILEEERKISKADIDAGGPFVKHEISRLGITMPLNEMPRDREPLSSTIESFDWGVIDRPDEEFSDTLCADYVVEKLKQKFDKPFFLGMGIYRPHQPLWVPKRFHDLYPPESVILPSVYQDDLKDVSKIAQDFGRYAVTSGAHKTTVEWGQWRNAVSAYMASISFADYLLGRVLDALDASPYADNTMIVMWSDHGWQLGEKEHWGKFTAWERSTRVPLIIVPPRNAQPKGFKPDTHSERPVSLLDVYPTVVDILGLDKRNDLDGRSLLPLIMDPGAKWNWPAVSAIGRGTFSVRDSRWRYIRYFDGSQELYDLKADPDEWTNVVDDPANAKVVARLSKQIPTEDGYKHFVRYGEYKAVIPEDGSRMLLYGPGSAVIYEDKDVSKDHPDIVQAINSYLKSNPEAGKYLAISK
ncbi:MAG: sulfatase [Verrucomicrobia bacterium]|nr:sulfatase [Verrucomicrobiota bacterium]